MSESTKISISEHLEEIREIQKIMRELKRTIETDGSYCPYNKVYPWQAEVVHEVRQILHDKIER